MSCISFQLFIYLFIHRPRQSSEDSGWMGYLSKAVSVGANYLPAQVTDVFSQGRAFASVHLPVAGVKNVCAITTLVSVCFTYQFSIFLLVLFSKLIE